MIDRKGEEVYPVVVEVLCGGGVSAEFVTCCVLVRLGGHTGNVFVVRRVQDGLWFLWRGDCDIDSGVSKVLVTVRLFKEHADVRWSDVSVVLRSQARRFYMDIQTCVHCFGCWGYLAQDIKKGVSDRVRKGSL